MGTQCEEVLSTLRRIIRAIDLHSRQLALRYGLTGPQLILLQELARLREVSVGSLAKKVSLSNGTVTDILDRLEKRGFVTRSRSEADKRRVYAHITERGQQVLQESPPLLHENFSADFERLQDWEQSLILSSLQRVAGMMEVQVDESIHLPFAKVHPFENENLGSLPYLDVNAPDRMASNMENEPEKGKSVV